MVPNGWCVKTLGDLTHYSAFGPRFSSDLYSDDGSVGTIRTTDLNDEGEINYSTIPYANVPDSFKSHFLDDGDLLITRSGSCGIPCVFVKQDKPIIAGAFLIRFVLNENADVTFLHALLKSEKVQIRIQNLASGGVQKNLSGTNLKKLELLVPPLPEQEKIAQILSTWDKAITTTEQLLANSQQQKKALMQQLLTGKKRLLDENGVRFSGEWRHGHLSDFGKITKGKALSSKDLIDGDYPVIAGGKSSPYNHRDYTHENVITVSASGAYAGYVAYHPYKLWASDCSVVMGKSNSNIGFIYQLMSHMQSKIYSLQSGGAQPHVYPKDLEVLRVNIPPVDEQQKIAAVLSTADQEITALQQKLDALKQEKKALMQQLLTGKRRVTLN